MGLTAELPSRLTAGLAAWARRRVRLACHLFSHAKEKPRWLHTHCMLQRCAQVTVINHRLPPIDTTLKEAKAVGRKGKRFSRRPIERNAARRELKVKMTRAPAPLNRH